MKWLLSVLMIVGTTVGGAMLALPAVTATYGYLASLLMITAICVINMMIAFFLLEAIMYFPPGINFISMSRQLLGRTGTIVASVLTVVFFYCLIAAYFAGASENLAVIFGVNHTVVMLLLTISVAAMLYYGFGMAAFINQFAVVGLLFCFCVMVFGVSSSIDLSLLSQQPMTFSYQPLPTIFTSFGFLAILPSIRDFLGSNQKQIKSAIVVGSLLPLIIYILWETVALGLLPLDGKHSLTAIASSDTPIQSMTIALVNASHVDYINSMITFFILFSMMGSLIGVSIALFDCLMDGVSAKSHRASRLSVMALVCIPTVTMGLLGKSLFLSGLHYAGLIAIVLFALYPILFVWSGRYVKQLADNRGGVLTKCPLILIGAFAIGMVAAQLLSMQSG